MNEQKKATHIGEILLACADDRKILFDGLYTGPWQISEKGVDGKFTYHSLLNEPERYSIKKEPKVVWVNVYKRDGTRKNTIFQHPTKRTAEHCVGSDAIVTAHPIELPE